MDGVWMVYGWCRTVDGQKNGVFLKGDSVVSGGLKCLSELSHEVDVERHKNILRRGK